MFTLFYFVSKKQNVMLQPCVCALFLSHELAVRHILFISFVIYLLKIQNSTKLTGL